MPAPGVPAWVVAALALGGAVVLQGPLGDSNALRRRNDFRYTPDTDVVRVLSFGHRSTAADTLWLRALPDFSREFSDLDQKRRWLSGVLDIAVELDPTFLTAYTFGATYLSLIDRRSEEAVALLERGARKFDEIEQADGRTYPAGTRVRVELAMAYWMLRRDRDATIRELQIAAQRPDCDELTRGMLVGLMIGDRDDLLALNYAAANTEHSDPLVRDRARLEYERTKLRIARRVANDFEAREGRRAKDLAELALGQALGDTVATLVADGLEVDAEGRVVSARFDELNWAESIRALEYAARIYRDDYGCWPDAAWLNDNKLFVARGENMPPHTHVAIDADGRVTFAPDEPETAPGDGDRGDAEAE